MYKLFTMLLREMTVFRKRRLLYSYVSSLPSISLLLDLTLLAGRADGGRLAADEAVL